MILYNLFPLLAGPFSHWPRHLSRASEMGFNWVFLNPIQKTGASRSLYSVADYFAINPALLDSDGPAQPDEQVRSMIRRARESGLRVMIDLVLSHCAIDSPLAREHPDWFVRESDGRVAHPSCQQGGERVVWHDLAQFDHRPGGGSEGLYRFCLRVVEHLIALGFEGFRCDAAYQIPPGFWRRLIGDIRTRHPRVCLVAETLGCSPEQTRETAGAGFDFVFNSSKWWNFTDPWLLEQHRQLRASAPSISFPESHDTARLNEEMNGNLAGLKQRYLFAALFSAGVMMPVGFEFGFRRPLHVVNTSPRDWAETGEDLRPFISRVNALKRDRPIFREEGPVDVFCCSNPNILLLGKGSVRGGDRALLILNKDVSSHQEFYADHLREFLPAGSRLADVSPEYPRDFVPEPFHYALRPGQGIVLVAGAAA